jgi:hypothetical protein
MEVDKESDREKNIDKDMDMDAETDMDMDTDTDMDTYVQGFEMSYQYQNSIYFKEFFIGLLRYWKKRP